MVLLREAFPHSSHKCDVSLEHFLATQVQRWTAGALPADLHPSSHATTGDAAPAALTQFRRAAAASSSLMQNSAAHCVAPPPGLGVGGGGAESLGPEGEGSSREESWAPRVGRDPDDPKAFDVSRPSPIILHMFNAYKLGNPGGEGAMSNSGLRSAKVGGLGGNVLGVCITA